MKKIISLLIIIFVFSNLSVFAKETNSNLKKGQKYYVEKNYTKSIDEFTKATKTLKGNAAAKEGLINSYIQRADIYANEQKEWGKAANDYRSALFYMEYYNPEANSEEMNQNIKVTKTKLEKMLKKLSFKKSPKNRYYTAHLLELAGEYPASAYEYLQASADKKLEAKCIQKVSNMF